MTEAIPKATPPKQEFVDKYPYIVYTDHHTIVYSDKPETSIDDVSGGGGGDATEYEIHSAYMTVQDESTVEIYEAEAPFVYKAVKGTDGWTADTESGAVTKAKAGEILICAFEQRTDFWVTLTPWVITSALPETPTSDEMKYPLVAASPIGSGMSPTDAGLFTFAMPAHNAWAIVID